MSQGTAGVPVARGNRAVEVLVLSRYGQLGASSRLRMLQYLPHLQRQHGFRFTHEALFGDDALRDRYSRGGYATGSLLRAYFRRLLVLLRRRKFDLVWVEKEALPWLPAWVERALLKGVPYVMDFDDAIFHNYDLHRSRSVRRWLGSRVDELMADASVVVAGNRYLADRATRAGAVHVEVVPTVIDLARYPPPPVKAGARKPLRIVWVGSPSTARYLQLLHDPLWQLAQRHEFVFRVIGGGAVAIPGVDVEVVDWSEASEVADITECDIGVMPLPETPWELGKCGYKLIQYMACGLPVVASPVGASREIVSHGGNGFLAGGAPAWVSSLEGLATDPALRLQMGAAGRARVEREFCLQVQVERLARLLMRPVTH